MRIKLIINKNKYEENLQHCIALLGDQEVNVVGDFIKANMELRNAYRLATEIHMRKYDTLAPDHQLEVNVPRQINHLSQLPDVYYFGVIVQYDRLGGKNLKYSHFVQGYCESLANLKLDYTQNSLDFKNP